MTNKQVALGILSGFFCICTTRKEWIRQTGNAQSRVNDAVGFFKMLFELFTDYVTDAVT